MPRNSGYNPAVDGDEPNNEEIKNTRTIDFNQLIEDVASDINVLIPIEKPDQESFLCGNEYINRFMGKDHFTNKEFADKFSGVLLTNPNAFRSVMNGLINGEIAERNKGTFIVACYDYLKNGKEAQDFKEKINRIAEEQFNRDGEKTVGKGYTRKAMAYSIDAELVARSQIISINEEVKSIEDRKKQEQERKIQERKAAAPDLNDATAYEWLMELPTKSKNAKGFRNSSAYNEFYNETKITSKLAEKLKKARDEGQENIPLSSFDSGTRARLADSANGDSVSLADLEKAYKASWKTLQTKAKAYSDFKLKTEGFTRNEDGPGRKLKEKSKEKFVIIDEVLGKTQRKPARAANDALNK